MLQVSRHLAFLTRHLQITSQLEGLAEDDLVTMAGWQKQNAVALRFGLKSDPASPLRRHPACPWPSEVVDPAGDPWHALSLHGRI